MELLFDLVLILGLSIAVVYVFHRLGIPAIVGFLITGALVGPHGLGLIHGVHEVETMAEIGVVLLLFTIGLEFSLKELVRIRTMVLAGGAIQVGGTVAVTALIVCRLGPAWPKAVFAGFLLALSSTAIVLKLLQERSALDSPAGRTCLAVLIFQDLVVVPMMLVLPLLAGSLPGSGQPWPVMLVKGLIAVAVLVAGGRWAIPWALSKIAETRNREMFLLAVVGLCLSVAVLTWWAGLSLALGAFAAGLIISESPYGLQAVGSVIPMRDIFTSLFFVSIGMLMNPAFLFSNYSLVAGVAASAIVLKFVLVALAVFLLGQGIRVAAMAGLALAQVGEFSFVLSRSGLELNLLSPERYNLFLVVAVLTMAATAPLTAAGLRIGKRAPRWISNLGLGRLWSRDRMKKGASAPEPVRGHLIVIGMGLAGQNVIKASEAAGIPYVVIELNPHTVRKEKRSGKRILYGDAINPSVLEHAGIRQADVLVITVPDPRAVRRITAVAKGINPKLHIIARTRYLSEMEAVLDLGADEVVPEEYETALEIFTRVLRRLLVPEDEIGRLLGELRARDYDTLRSLPVAGCVPWASGLFGEMEIVTLRLAHDAPLDGISLKESSLRETHGVTVLAVRRDNKTVPNPDAKEVLTGGDRVVILGDKDKVAAAAPLFGPPLPGSD